jgi:hypothetical protein
VTDKSHVQNNVMRNLMWQWDGVPTTAFDAKDPTLAVGAAAAQLAAQLRWRPLARTLISNPTFAEEVSTAHAYQCLEAGDVAAAMAWVEVGPKPTALVLAVTVELLAIGPEPEAWERLSSWAGENQSQMRFWKHPFTRALAQRGLVAPLLALERGQVWGPARLWVPPAVQALAEAGYVTEACSVLHEMADVLPPHDVLELLAWGWPDDAEAIADLVETTLYPC